MTDEQSILTDNPWRLLRQFTAARIALGRAGTSLTTADHLAFQLAHSRARKAVHYDLDVERLVEELAPLGLESLKVNSLARTRDEYLQRPDLGRRLDEASCKMMRAYKKPEKAFDVVIVISDGLSALAIEKNAANFLAVLLPVLEQSGLRLAPLVIANEARVALGDEIALLLGATLVVTLIGERPGLSAPDSLGVYLTYAPEIGTTDEARNCISNIRDGGLGYDEAAFKLSYLIREAFKRGLSGIGLKDEAGNVAAVEAGADGHFLTP